MEHARNRAVARRLAVLVLATVLVLVPADPTGVGAASEPGARRVGGPPPTGAPACATYRVPVDGPVVDPFRLPDGPYGAGNRGLEYATAPGAPARAIGAGVVTFAGSVAGRLALSVQHPDGHLSSLTGLASITVRRGELVARGSVVGTTGARTHLGVRMAGRYIDPAGLLCGGRRRAVLVPDTP